MLWFFKKGKWKKKDIASMDQMYQRTTKFIEMKSFVILEKKDEMYNILKPLLATGNGSRDEGRIGLSNHFAGAFTKTLPY